MTVEITSPKVETLIRERLVNGAFSDAQGVILDAPRTPSHGGYIMLSPEEFVMRYRDLPVNCLVPYFDPPIYCAENKKLAIVRYVSGHTTYTTSVRGRIRKFLNDQAAKGDAGVVPMSTDCWSLPYLPIEPIHSFSDHALARALYGKGSIWEIQCTLRIASLMMASFDTTKAFYGAHDLQTFVNYFVGMDCNGLVGAYPREIAGANPGTGSLSCAERDFIYHSSDTITAATPITFPLCELSLGSVNCL